MPAAPPKLTAALAAAALLASGCAGAQKDSAKDFTGAEKQVATTVEDLQAAGKKGDETKICDDLLATALVNQIKQAKSTTCATAVSTSLDDVDSYDIQVKKVTVSGTTATAAIESKDKDGNRPDTLTLVKEKGRWRISSLGG
jgi:hypothetical protein